MKKRMWNRRPTLYLLILIVFFSVLLPLYVFGTGLFQWGYHMNRKEIDKSLQVNGDFVIDTLEAEIRRIQQMQYECLNDEMLYYYVNAYPIMTEYERVEALLNLQSRLGIMKNSSVYIEDANLYLPAQHRTISAQKGVQPGTLQWEGLFEQSKAQNSDFLYKDGVLYLCASYPLRSAAQAHEPLYVLLIKLSSEAVADHLLPLSSYPEGGTVLLNKAQDFCLSNGIAGKDLEEILPYCLAAAGDDLSQVQSFQIGKERYLLMVRRSDYLGLDLFSYLPERYIYTEMERYRNMFFVFSGMALVVVAVFSFALYRLVQRPMKLLATSLQKVEQGDLTVRIVGGTSNVEFDYLYRTFNDMVQAIKNLLDQNAKQWELTQQAQLRQLQAQVNPHFLYNSFFILYRMASDEDYEGITHFLTHLSEYYRFLTRNANSDIPLEQEMEHARNYMAIQLLRFGRRIRCEFAPLPDAFRPVMVPRLIVQPILENAFEHGLKDVEADGLIRVGFSQEAGFFTITVENNGGALTDEKLAGMKAALSRRQDGEITGILNIHRRLQLKFGESSGLSLSRGVLGGLRVEIRIRPRQTRGGAEVSPPAPRA